LIDTRKHKSEDLIDAKVSSAKRGSIQAPDNDDRDLDLDLVPDRDWSARSSTEGTKKPTDATVKKRKMFKEKKEKSLVS
jgi:hypothetical protein